MTARTGLGFRRGALAALLAAALLGGCATAGQNSVAGAPSPDGLMRLADKARDRGELPIAASLYRRAYDADPQRARPLVSLGQVLMEMQAPEQASEAFSAALVIEPQNVDALRGMGTAQLALRRPEEAIPPLKQALAISANDFRVLNALGVAFDLTGDRGGAHQFYRTGLKLAPDNAPLRSNYALSLALSGDSEGALETIQPLAGRPIATAQQRQTMALVYGLAGQQAEAERLARMDLDEATVAENMQRIAALRGDAAGGPELARQPEGESTGGESTGGEATVVAAVLSEPLPESSKPKIEPVALKAREPAAAPKPSPAAATPPAPPSTPSPAPVQQQAALAPAPEPKAAAAPAAAEAKAATQPVISSQDVWLVQIASYYRPDMAEKGWTELSAAAPELFADRKHLVEQARLEDETIVYRLRMGPYEAYSEAADICEQLKTRGLECYVAQPGS